MEYLFSELVFLFCNQWSIFRFWTKWLQAISWQGNDLGVEILRCTFNFQRKTGWVYIDRYFKSYYVKRSPLWFGRFQNLSERVATSTMPFSGKQHFQQNVNPPPLMMMPAVADPIIQTANKRDLSKKLQGVAVLI